MIIQISNNGRTNYPDILPDVEMVCEHVEVFPALLPRDVGRLPFLWVGETWKFL